MDRRDLASFGERSPSVAPQGACGSGGRFVYRSEIAHSLTRVSIGRACASGFALDRRRHLGDLGLGADSCDRFRVPCARILKKRSLAELEGALDAAW